MSAEGVPEKSFELPPDVYDAIIDWQKRLGKELPFYRAIFERWAVRRVLDMACGTGRHAVAFHSWGLEVVAVDASPAMVEFAHRAYGTSDRLRWCLGNFTESPSPGGYFDAAVCVGNSLALAEDSSQVEQVVRNLLAAVRPGGIVLIHLVNTERIRDRATTWTKITFCALEGKQLLALKGFHRLGQRMLASFVLVDVGGPKIVASWDEVLLCDALPVAIQAAARGGAGSITLFADYDLSRPVVVSDDCQHAPLPDAQDFILCLEKPGG